MCAAKPSCGPFWGPRLPRNRSSLAILIASVAVQIPLTVVWAGGTVFDLTRDLATRRTGALSALPRVAFISLTALAQLVGVVSKTEAALLALLPYERAGALSDDERMARYIVRPQNAVEAFGMAFRAALEARPRPAMNLLSVFLVDSSLRASLVRFTR